MLETLRSWVSKGRGNNQPTVPTETPGPGAPGPIQGQAQFRSLPRTHGRRQSWCRAPMPRARAACRALAPRHPFRGWQPDRKTGASCLHSQASIPFRGKPGHPRTADPLSAPRDVKTRPGPMSVRGRNHTASKKAAGAETRSGARVCGGALLSHGRGTKSK